MSAALELDLQSSGAADRSIGGRTVMGCDPGAGGALCLVDSKADILAVEDMPVIDLDGKRRINTAAVVEIFRSWNPSIVIIERGITISQQSAAGSFWFGYSCGILEASAIALGYPVTLAYPITWKKAMGVTGDKGACRLVASRMWPGKHQLFKRGRDDGRAEAALIAAYQVMQWGARG